MIERVARRWSSSMEVTWRVLFARHRWFPNEKLEWSSCRSSIRWNICSTKSNHRWLDEEGKERRRRDVRFADPWRFDRGEYSLQQIGRNEIDQCHCRLHVRHDKSWKWVLLFSSLFNVFLRSLLSVFIRLFTFVSSGLSSSSSRLSIGEVLHSSMFERRSPSSVPRRLSSIVSETFVQRLFLESLLDANQRTVQLSFFKWLLQRERKTRRAGWIAQRDILIIDGDCTWSFEFLTDRCRGLIRRRKWTFLARRWAFGWYRRRCGRKE